MVGADAALTYGREHNLRPHDRGVGRTLGVALVKVHRPELEELLMIKPTLHHVTIKTSHLDDMIKWYALVVGAKVQFRYGAGAWMTNDGANHRIAFFAEKNRHNGMHHCAFEYGSFADLMTSFDRLPKAGVEPAFCLDHGMTISLYYKDPEGNFVELQADSFSDWKFSAEWMRTSPDFAADPIGTFFDPALVYEKFQSGVDFKTLQPTIRAGAYKPNSMPDIGLPTP